MIQATLLLSNTVHLESRALHFRFHIAYEARQAQLHEVAWPFLTLTINFKIVLV